MYLLSILPEIKDEILARDGKLVIRPDSGDPVDIICGLDSNPEFKSSNKGETRTPMQKGVIELLWDLFGGTYVTGNDGKEYKVLDSHIGAIYGDGITLERAQAICERLKKKGFASTNVVLGIGSYTYQHNTRDTFGFAMKATYGEITHVEHDSDVDIYVEPREIFKDPITDDGTKKSKKGLLKVHEVYGKSGDTRLAIQDQCSWKEEGEGMLQTVFKDGKLVRTTTLEEIRKRLTV